MTSKTWAHTARQAGLAAGLAWALCAAAVAQDVDERLGHRVPSVVAAAA